MGIMYRPESGLVIRIKPDSQAQTLNVQPNWYIDEVDGHEYHTDLVQITIHSGKPYKVRFRKFVILFFYKQSTQF